MILLFVGQTGPPEHRPVETGAPPPPAPLTPPMPHTPPAVPPLALPRARRELIIFHTPPRASSTRERPPERGQSPDCEQAPATITTATTTATSVATTAATTDTTIAVTATTGWPQSPALLHRPCLAQTPAPLLLGISGSLPRRRSFLMVVLEPSSARQPVVELEPSSARQPPSLCGSAPASYHKPERWWTL